MIFEHGTPFQLKGVQHDLIFMESEVKRSTT